MKKTVAWCLAGVVAGAAVIILLMMLRWEAPRYVPAPGLFHFNWVSGRAAWIIWVVAWGGLYALCYHWLLRHFLPAPFFASSLMFALLLFLLACFFLPLLERRPFVVSLFPLFHSAVQNFCFALAALFLGRQME